MKKLFASVLTTLLALSTALEDYCDPELCRNTGGNKHIACNNNGDCLKWHIGHLLEIFETQCTYNRIPVEKSFHERCSPDARLVDLNFYIPLILNEHNERRNKVAAGNVTGYASAKRMAVMQWDNELADVATYNVKKCDCEYDGCRNVRRFKYTGQNIVSQGYTGKENAFSNKEIILDAIESWFEEYIGGSMTYMNNYPDDFDIYKEFSHFALLVTEASNYVGCAASRYKEEQYNTVLLTCNYASAALQNRPIYVEGPTASGCKSGKNDTYPALCSIAEVYE